MASLTFGELKKRAGRIETLVRLFSEGHAFESDKSSKKIVLQSIYLTKKNTKPFVASLKDVKTDKQRIKLVKKIRQHTGKINYTGYVGADKEEITIAAGALKKSKEFGGGGGGGKGGGSESLAVRAETLIKKGKLERIEFAGQKVECRTFPSIKMLKVSILEGLKDNKKIPKYIVDSFESYLSPSATRFDKIGWSEAMPDNELNQLGKYAGEVITGLIAIGGPRSSYLPNIIKAEKVDKFCVPTDPAFTGVDVFLLMKDGTIYPISNKYGKGAAASFFANLLPKCMKHEDTLRHSPLRDFVRIAKKHSNWQAMERRGAPSKEILYDYGVRELLNIPSGVVRDPYDVYRQAKSGKYSPEVHCVVEAIKEYDGVDRVVLDNLPMSITAFMTRETAKILNGSKKAVEDMKEVLAGKNYWQANLMISEWSGGKIKYKFVNSGKIRLDIIGTKSSTRDLTGKQGLLNYFMALP